MLIGNRRGGQSFLMCQSQVINRHRLLDLAVPPPTAQRKTLFIVYHWLLSSQLVGCRPGSVVILHKALSTAEKTTRPSSINPWRVTSSDEAWP